MLADEWVMSNMYSAKHDEIGESLNVDEAKLRAIRSYIDPSQVVELEGQQHS